MTKSPNTRGLQALICAVLLASGLPVLAQAETANPQSSPSKAPSEWSLEEVLLFNTQKSGGDSYWSAVQNVRVHLDIREPTFEVKGIYVASRSGSMRIDIYAGEDRVFSESILGEVFLKLSDTVIDGFNTTKVVLHVALVFPLNNFLFRHGITLGKKSFVLRFVSRIPGSELFRSKVFI